MLLIGAGVVLAGMIGLASEGKTPYFSRHAGGSEYTNVPFTEDQEAYSCPEKPKVRAKENAIPVTYKFVTVESDRCLWQFGGTNDEGTLLERNGADVVCVVMATLSPVFDASAIPPDGMLIGHLENKGYKPVRISSTLTSIGGRNWRHEIAENSYVPPPADVGVHARNLAWTWIGPAGMASLLCVGTRADVIAEDAEIRRLADSLRIVETPPKTK